MRASPGPRACGLVGVELVGEGTDWQGRVATFSTFLVLRSFTKNGLFLDVCNRPVTVSLRLTTLHMAVA